MALFHHNVTCNEVIENILREKHISPSEAFREGVKKMALIPHHAVQGETIMEESKISKLMNAKEQLQRMVLEQSEQLEQLMKERAKDGENI